MLHHLAIDRPSPKFVSFLKKYYGLRNAITQVLRRIPFKVLAITGTRKNYLLKISQHGNFLNAISNISL